MKIKITKTDVQKATRDYKKQVAMVKCCPVFQACKRRKIPIKSCAYTVIILKNGNIISLDGASKITESSSRSWGEAVGKTFEVEGFYEN